MKLFILFLLVINPYSSFSLRSLQTQEKPAYPQINFDAINKMKEVAENRSFVEDRLCGGYNSLGLCSICYGGYFDQKSFKCVKIENQKANCQSYLPNGFCAVCKPGFWFDHKKEECVANSIQGCKFMNFGKCTVNFYNLNLLV